MLCNSIYGVICLIVFSVLPTFAADEAKQFSDEAELSLVDSSGNSKMTSIAMKNLLKYNFSPATTGSWKLGLLYGQSDGETNAQQYFTDLRLDHSYSDRKYTFANAGGLHDKFAGIDFRYTAGSGGGYRFLTGTKHFMVGELGLTFTRDEYNDVTSTVSNYVGSRLFGKYTYAFTDKSNFTQSVEYLQSFMYGKKFNLNSETAIKSALNEKFSVKGRYTVKYDNAPVPGTLEQTDRLLAVALVMGF